MGAWGVAIFADDLAADLRDEFRGLIGDGLHPTEAVDRLMAEYSASLEDADEMPVFWIALACTQWKLGRLEERTKQMALQAIDSGTDLMRWDDPKTQAKRAVVLEKARAELVSPPPPAKRIARTVKESNDWEVGETIGFRLLSGQWTLFRVVGHHSDKGGRFAICELLNWVDDHLPPVEKIADLSIKREKPPGDLSQFIFQQPKKKTDQARVLRMGVSTPPLQKAGGFAAFVWPYVDKQLASIFDLR